MAAASDHDTTAWEHNVLLVTSSSGGSGGVGGTVLPRSGGVDPMGGVGVVRPAEPEVDPILVAALELELATLLRGLSAPKRQADSQRVRRKRVVQAPKERGLKKQQGEQQQQQQQPHAVRQSAESAMWQGRADLSARSYRMLLSQAQVSHKERMKQSAEARSLRKHNARLQQENIDLADELQGTRDLLEKTQAELRALQLLLQDRSNRVGVIPAPTSTATATATTPSLASAPPLATILSTPSITPAITTRPSLSRELPPPPPPPSQEEPRPISRTAAFRRTSMGSTTPHDRAGAVTSSCPVAAPEGLAAGWAEWDRMLHAVVPMARMYTQSSEANGSELLPPAPPAPPLRYEQAASSRNPLRAPVASVGIDLGRVCQRRQEVKPPAGLAGGGAPLRSISSGTATGSDGKHANRTTATPGAQGKWIKDWHGKQNRRHADGLIS